MRITPILTRSALVLAGATLAVGIIACTAGTSTENAIPALDVPAPVSESTWTDAPIERLPAPEVVVTTPPTVEVAPVVSAPVEVPAPTCEERGLITAEDMTCVPLSFYDDVAPATPLAPITLYPCAEEDSEMCYWDGARMGNGTGRSFIRLFGVTYYAE